MVASTRTEGGAFRVLIRRDGAQLAGEASPQCPPSSIWEVVAQDIQNVYLPMWLMGKPQLDGHKYAAAETSFIICLFLNVAHILVSGRCMHSSHPGGSCVGQWPLTSGWCDSLYAGPPCADRQDQGWQAMGFGKILINLPSGWSLRCHWPMRSTNIQRSPTNASVFCFFEKDGCFRNWVFFQAYVSWFGGDWPLVNHMSNQPSLPLRCAKALATSSCGATHRRWTRSHLLPWNLTAFLETVLVDGWWGDV